MTVDEAIKLAIHRVQELFAGQDHRLEEVTVLDDGGFDVTVSFREAGSSARSGVVGIGTDSPLPPAYGYGKRTAIGIDASRIYKEVKVGTDGQVKHIHMRPIVVG